MTSASSIVAVFALIFWSFQLAPQALLNYRRQSTDGLSPLLLLSWSLASSFTAVNNITTRLSPLFIIQPNLFLLFSLTCYAQCYYYPPAATASHASNTDAAAAAPVTTSTSNTSAKLRPTPLRAAGYGLAALLLCLTIQLVLSLPLLPSHLTPTSPPLLVVNILSLLLFLLAYLPQYTALIRHPHTAASLSLLFLAVDMAGAVLSVVALGLGSGFEVVEAVCYLGVLVGDGGLVCLKLRSTAAEKSSGAKAGAPVHDGTLSLEQRQHQPQEQETVVVVERIRDRLCGLEPVDGTQSIAALRKQDTAYQEASR